MEIKAGAVEKGIYLLMKDVPFIVLEREFVNPGKGSAFVRMKLKNARTGAVLKETQKTQDNLTVVDVQEFSAQYMYSDDENLYFMNMENFDQFSILKEVVEDKLLFMKETDVFKVVLWEKGALDVKIPPKMVFVVTEAEDAVKGDSVSNLMKNAVIETGAVIRVPLFIKTGEKIMVNTDTKEYVERVNK